MWSKYNVFLMFFYCLGVMLGILKFKLIIKKPIMTKKSISLQIYGFCLTILLIIMAPLAIYGFHDLIAKAFKSANHTIFDLISNGRLRLQFLVVLHFYIKIILNKKTYEDLINKILWIHNEILVKYQKNIVFPVSCERIFYLMLLKVIFVEIIVPFSYTPYVSRIGDWEKENMKLFYGVIGFLFYGFNFTANIYYIGILYMSHVFETLNLQLLLVLRKAEFLNTNLTELLECSDEIDNIASTYCEVSNFLKDFMEFIGFSSTFTLIANSLTCVGQVTNHIILSIN